ncbi:GNAT family N-acetyltransferase [Pseudoroseicyclus sp. CLL3-39]|uniref:GNAT family N-acetyltransferase n=2 Tax=Pseudoroseicyclus tamaricis TaxID=2705421 RepID=A0A6B2JZ92_9RHOB|nr:GNAT family N-acetyltransferase [Pseudoroseicyclus tamaricis]
MEGRIDPPSSMLRLTLTEVEAQAAGGEVWAIGAPVTACLFLTPKPPSLYLGKLAVAASARGRGLARTLISEAEARARALGLAQLELSTRVELADNHAAFAALGFTEAARTSHPGYARPTSITYRRPVA